MFIACTKPYFVLTNPGYVRLSLEDYSTDNFGKGDKLEKSVHLTNAAVQKTHPNYKDQKDSSIMSMKQLGEYFVEQG